MNRAKGVCDGEAIAPPTGAQRPGHTGSGREEEIVVFRGCNRPPCGLPMIRNVLVMGKSGLVLFSREFANSVQQV